MFGKLISLILSPLVGLFGLFSTRKNIVVEVAIVLIATLLIVWYVYTKTSFNSYQVGVSRTEPGQRIQDSLKDSKYIGPKKSQSKIIRSSQDLKP